jgi:very-long-chain enoyl-CoA reductase
MAYWIYHPYFSQGQSVAVRNDVWLYGTVAVWAVSGFNLYRMR